MKSIIKVLITGGSGMVGKNILEHPHAARFDILHPTREKLDLMKIDLVEEYIRYHKPDIVIHAAGLVGGIQANLENPLRFLDENMTIGRNVITTSFKVGIRSLLNLGSSCMYPSEANNPLTEDQLLSGPLEKTNEGYAIAKLVSLKLCQYINNLGGELNYKTLIPCNLYGKYDYYQSNRSHFIPAIIQKIHYAKLNGINTVNVWGDGKSKREVMFAGDFAELVWNAVDNLGILPNIMNIGVGKDLSVVQYYEIISDIIKWQGKLDFDKSKPNGMRQKLCSTKHQQILGWTTKTSLQTGLELTYNSFLEENYAKV